MNIQKIGICTSIQDLGRQGHYESGLNSNGALDVFSLKKVNLILNNSISEAAIECFYPAAEILFEENGILALSGGDFGAELNTRKLLLNKQYAFNQGDILRFKRKIKGHVVYLGFKGGLDLPKFEDSKSSSKPLFFNELEKNTKIKLIQSGTFLDVEFGISESRKTIANTFSVVFNNIFSNKVSCMFFDNKAEILLDSNRMGFRLKFENPIKLEEFSSVSTFVSPGSIQILPNGDAIVLMADAQVTGGYPVIGFVSSVDLYRLSQVSIGQKIKFESISLEKARQKKSDQENELNLIGKNINLWKSIVT
jgi:biotin-dependent carboxylase-like uncharacterized protein